MKNYNQEYYFIEKDESNERLPSLLPDRNTQDRRFRHENEQPGSPPLVFSNGWKHENLKNRTKDVIADILFDGSNFMVKGYIRERLLNYDISNLNIHPAIYIDDRDTWHEDYWYLTFTRLIDCWDRATSTYNPKPMNIADETLFGVYTYGLDTGILESLPLSDRLLFKMGGTVRGMVVCHKSLRGLFRGGGLSGAMLTAISDY
jgi:hypothetical protein